MNKKQAGYKKYESFQNANKYTGQKYIKYICDLL